MGRLAEVNDNFRHLRRHLLTGTDVERYPAPTPVTDAQLHRNISLRSRVGSHSLFLTIPLLIARSRILSANDMFIQVRLRKRSQRLINHRRVNLIQLKRRLQIIPEWLLNNNTRMRSIQPGRLQMQRHHPIQRRRSSQIEQQIIRIDLLRKLYQTLPQLRISLHFRRIHRQIIQMRHKRRHQLQILLFSLYKLLQLPKYI